MMSLAIVPATTSFLPVALFSGQTEKCHIPPDLVVNRWACNGESGSHRAFLCRHDAWALVRRQIQEEITSHVSMTWDFPTKSSGMWKIVLFVSFLPHLCPLGVTLRP